MPNLTANENVRVATELSSRPLDVGKVRVGDKVKIDGPAVGRIAGWGWSGVIVP